MATVTPPVAEETDRAAPVRRRGRRWVAAVVVVMLLGTAGFLVATQVFDIGAPAKQASIDSGAPSATAQITQQKLTSQTRVSGTLGYAGSFDIVNSAQGTVTKVPSDGQVMERGKVLYRVADKPVVLLYGAAVPLYRALSWGMKGADVRQLNTELVALGYADEDNLDPDSKYFGAATYNGLRRMQKALGMDRDGTLDLADAIFLNAKKIRITKATGKRGASAPSGTILQATSTDRHVTVALEAAQASTVKRGDNVTVTLPNLKNTPGKVSHIGTVAKKSDSGSLTIDVYIALSKPGDVGSLDQAPVQVAINSGSVEDAFAVPVNSLLALAGGGYAVEVVQADGTHRLVPVQLGLFDDGAGLVQITGDGIQAGQSIVVPGVMTSVASERGDRIGAGVGGDGFPRTPVLELAGVRKTYPGATPVTALDGVDFTIYRGELVAIVGPSGSGKSTLLHVMGTLERPSAGSVRIVGSDAARMSDGDLALLRATRIGFVFQQFFLAEHATALENVADGLLYSGVRRADRNAAAVKALTRVGLARRMDHRPSQLSGGERQRVAIARALIGNPDIVLADEPTGNLDSNSAAAIFQLLRELHNDGATIIVITHDRDLAARLPRRIEVLDGHIVADEAQDISGLTDPEVTGAWAQPREEES